MKRTDNVAMELLAPAGSMASLIAAVNAGADAVYMGGPRFGARAYAENPDEDGLQEALEYVHLHGRKLFLTVNTLMKEKELEEELLPYLKPLYEAGLDAVIVQDPGVLSLLKQELPELPLHASTQTTVCGPEGAALLQQMGVSRLVLPRELSLKEIREIYDRTGMELEVFVHGALCYCYSGQCLMSSFLGGRSGNRGRCAQPCRLDYEGGRLLNLKDLCALELLPELQASGACSLKVEGRMKSPEYTAGVISVYRKYLDLLESSDRPFRVAAEDKRFLSSLFDRGGFTEGYFRQHNGGNMLVTGAREAYVTASAETLGSINESYGAKRPLKARGLFTAVPGEAISLRAGTRDAEYTAFGEAAQTASGRPLDEQGAGKQLRKTGDSGFVWDGLEMHIAEGCFVPVSQLNALRREALAGLKEALLASYRRPLPTEKAVGTTPEIPVPQAPAKPLLAVELEDPALLDTVLGFDAVGAVYLPLDALGPEGLTAAVRQVRNSGKTAYAAFPYVFREEMRRAFTAGLEALKEAAPAGWLVKSLDEAGFVREQGLPGELIFDAGLYAWNRRAAAFYRELGAQRLTYPREPHEKDLRALKPLILPMETVIYGRIPMMLSAQCLAKTAGHCLREAGKPAVHRPGLYSFRDRTGAVLQASLRCRYCYNVIYNPVPLWLGDLALPESSVLRISLTTETPEEARRVLTGLTAEAPADRTPPGNAEFTRGHYRRGVQ